MYTATDLALARQRIARAEARLARMTALTHRLAESGCDKMAAQGAALIEVMTAGLCHRLHHARMISTALSVQRRAGLP